MLRVWLIGALWVVSPAFAQNAKQLEQSVEVGAVETVLSFSWRAAGRDAVEFALQTEAIEADTAIRRKIQLADLHEAMARAARQSARGRKAVELTARGTASGVSLGASGPGKATRAAMAQAQSAMEAEKSSWLVENQVFALRDGSLSWDHARVIAERAEAVAPAAAALREGMPSDRAFIERALAFAQSIPYQKGKRGTDSGFQRPLALLRRNRGDCDGKSALFLAMVRAELPDVPLAMVYVEGHALTGVGVTAEKGDRTFTSDGVEYVYAEPVGPAAYPLGQTAPANKKSGKKGQVRAVP